MISTPSVSLTQHDKAKQKSTDEVYLEQFGIRNANALALGRFDPLHSYYDGIIPAVGLTHLPGCLKLESWLALNFAEYMDQQGIPVHYLAAEDNERRLKSRIEAVF